MADAQASGACGRKIVWVQVPSPALFFSFVTNTRAACNVGCERSGFFFGAGSDPVAFFCCANFFMHNRIFFCPYFVEKSTLLWYNLEDLG